MITLDEQAARTRARLLASALSAAGLLLVMLLLTLQTMRGAHDVGEQASISHERMRSLWTLNEASKRYQKVSYEAARGSSADLNLSRETARAGFDEALARVLSLPSHDDHQAQFAARLPGEARAVLEQLEQAEATSARIEEAWVKQGYRQARAELYALSVPYDRFYASLAGEVAYESRQFTAAMERTESWQGKVRLIVLTILFFGLLMSVTLFFVLLKRLELRRAHQALAREDERRRTFLVDASHELRLPLTIIRGEAQIALRQRQISLTDANDAFSRILTQARAVIRIIDDLFLIARAEAGGLRMTVQPVDVGSLAVQTAANFSTMACESGSQVLCRSEAGLWIQADVDRIRQILAALIDNALRHTRPGVTVEIDARRDGEQVILRVMDDGPGIDPASAEELFQRFRRGRTSGEGSGLGLTVVRALAIAHGGQVSISRSPTGGACISVVFAHAIAVAEAGDREQPMPTAA